VNDWYITDLAGGERVSVGTDTKGGLFFMTEQTKRLNKDIYWLAPPEYTGNKVCVFVA